MKRSHFIAGTTVFGLMGPRVWAGEAGLHQQLKRGDVQTGLRIFNLYGEKPQEMQTLLSHAYTFLDQSPDSTVAELAKDTTFKTLVQQAGLTHLGGPMLGCLSTTGVSVWVRTLKPATVTIEANGRTFAAQSTEQSDLTAIVPVTGLTPDTETPYRLLIDGRPIQTGSQMVIRTISEKPAVSRIAFGSCWHRWGLGNPMMDTVRQRKPLALLAIGDIAVQDRKGHLGLIRNDILMRDQFPEWQRFSAEIPVYASWDDHDYAANDYSGVMKDFTATNRTGVRDVFAQSWVNPSYGNERHGIFLKTRIGPADVIMTDNRYFRDHAKGKNAFLGKEQMDWLKAQLLACNAPFIILSCGTMWDHQVSNGKDSWGRFDKAGREEIFQFIEDHKIGGLLLISGDRHGARGFTIPRTNGFSFYEFGGACFGGRQGPPTQDPKWKNQLYGIAGEYAYSEFEFDTTQPDPTVTMRLTHASGREIYATTLTRSQLTPT